ncbi:CLC_0170 family protein [Cohnella hongkongensis]|uniref:CLC_0170 family protein n=1 Tax=Cohnella hongkongensis TaxID=178337 RepID=A0ABV9FCQ9_9BACL
MHGSGYAGSLGYVVPLCIFTGLLMLRWEVVMYKKMKMMRERRFAKVCGWINIVTGALLYAGNWAFDHLL